MKPKRLLRRLRANDDVDGAIDHYLSEGGERAAGGFVAALEEAFRQIARFPGMGSPRFGVELDVAGLRSWPLRRYPFIVFYIEHADAVEILRVLHAQRDIPPLLQ